MTAERIAKARALALEHGGKSGRIILDLCLEVERLRRLTLRKGTHPVSVTDPWPYNPHRGVPLCECPEPYLLEWAAARSRNGLMFDVHLGVIAQRDMALFDLIIRWLAAKPKDKDNAGPFKQTETLSNGAI